MRKQIFAALLMALAPAGLASADVKAKAPDGFTIQIKSQTKRDRDEAWAHLLDIASWWSSAHTYSGEAKSLSIDARAGGCWCEIWNGGEVEHGRVVLVMPREIVRFDTSLGPLQDLGVKAAMTLTLSDGTEGRTMVTLDYKVTGSSLSGLDVLAPVVEGVLAEAMTRFAAPDPLK